MSSIRSLPAWRALVGADLQIFFRDKRSLILNLATPLVIAGLFGMVFGGGGQAAPGRMPIAVVDQDASEVSRAIVAGLAAERTLEVLALDREAAREQVRQGKVRAAIVLPAGFGDAAGKAFLGGNAKPRVPVLYDPSQIATLPMVQGLLTQQVFSAVTGNLFSGQRGAELIDESLATLDAQGLDVATTGDLRELLMRARNLNQRNRADPGDGTQPATGAAAPPRSGLTVPFELADEAVTSGRTPYNGFAHACAGMGVQFILMMGIEAGVGLLLLRRRGLWLRLKAAPLARSTLLAARVGSVAILSLAMFAFLYAGAALLYGVRVDGSMLGFVGIAVAFSLTTAAFGLLIAALGQTPEATRGLAIFATLVMVLLGGGWVPSFLFPEWLQTAGAVLPTRWAIQGLEAMTWRGLGLDQALPAIGALLGFTAAFLAIAIWRFRWDPA
jgi:ABC-2 type transport system permease protein